LDELTKKLTQSVRRLPPTVRNTDAFTGQENLVKDFVVTCPIIISLRYDYIYLTKDFRDTFLQPFISILTLTLTLTPTLTLTFYFYNRSPCMRDRHWKALMKVVGVDFLLPTDNPSMPLRRLLEMNLHVYANSVEEIADQAIKEAKHEETLLVLDATWSEVNFSMHAYKDTDVNLLRLEDDIVEQLESDQMAVQSIVGSRYGHFKEEALEWQRALGAVSDVTQLLSELLRTWSYLEPLFVGSAEVKRELPVEAERFGEVDTEVKGILQVGYCFQPYLSYPNLIIHLS
jgi:hypothetical protein